MKLVYVDNDHSRYWLACKANAERHLDEPNWVCPNGRDSHDVFGELLEKAELELIDDLAIQVTH